MLDLGQEGNGLLEILPRLIGGVAPGGFLTGQDQVSQGPVQLRAPGIVAGKQLDLLFEAFRKQPLDPLADLAVQLAASRLAGCVDRPDISTWRKVYSPSSGEPGSCQEIRSAAGSARRAGCVRRPSAAPRWRRQADDGR
jgi:hypothetical protein